MSTPIKIILSIIIMYFLMVSVDLYLTYSHEKTYGPYKHSHAKITFKNSWCGRGARNEAVGNNDIQLIINNSTYRTENPYIGLYPMRLCFYGTYIPLYDYNKISNLKVGDSMQVIIANDNKVYLGKTSYQFNIITMVILLFCFFLIKYFNKSFKPTPKSGAV